MSLTAEQLQTRIDALQTAMDAGVMRVRHGMDFVDYQSVDQMAKALARLKARLDTANGTPRAKVNYIEQRSKGFGHGRHGCEWEDD